MYKKTNIDWKFYTSTNESKTIWNKIKGVRHSPGMKMVLMHRFINETPKYLFFIKPIFKFLYYRMMYKYGIDLPLNLEFGQNLRIYHWGGIVINPDTKIGDNVTIMHNVMIGNNMKNIKCPVISDGVFIGVGAKIIGDVFLAKNIKVGANAVVTKSISEENITLVGVPAQIIKSIDEEMS
jgi:serine acetyltransferase